MPDCTNSGGGMPPDPLVFRDFCFLSLYCTVLYMFTLTFTPSGAAMAVRYVVNLVSQLTLTPLPPPVLWISSLTLYQLSHPVDVDLDLSPLSGVAVAVRRA